MPKLIRLLERSNNPTDARKRLVGIVKSFEAHADGIPLGGTNIEFGKPADVAKLTAEIDKLADKMNGDLNKFMKDTGRIGTQALNIKATS